MPVADVNKTGFLSDKLYFNDFNEVVNTGIWTLYNIDTSHPNSPNIRYGILEVIATADDFIIQKAYDVASSATVKIRVRPDNKKTWSEWRIMSYK